MARLNDSVVVYENSSLPDPQLVWEDVVKERTNDDVKDNINVSYENLVKDFTIREFVVRWIQVAEERYDMEVERGTYTVEKGLVENYPVVSDNSEIRERNIDPPFIFNYTEIDCEDCSGTGTICRNCDSKGYVSCSMSSCESGTIVGQCTECFGSGRVSTECNVCDGTGFSIEEQCVNCGGTGCNVCGGGIFRESCSNCSSGTAKEICDTCRGSGEEKKGECNNCSQYSDTLDGTIACPECNNGEDESICEHCVGYGIFHQVELVVEMEKISEEHRMPVTGEDEMRKLTQGKEWNFDSEFVDDRRVPWYFESNLTPKECEATSTNNLQPVSPDYSPNYTIEYQKSGYNNPVAVHRRFRDYFRNYDLHVPKGFLQHPSRSPGSIETTVKKSEVFYEYNYHYVDGISGNTPVYLTQDHEFIPNIKPIPPGYITNHDSNGSDVSNNNNSNDDADETSSNKADENISSNNIIEDMEYDPTPSDRGIEIDPSVKSVSTIGKADDGGFLSGLF